MNIERNLTGLAPDLKAIQETLPAISVKNRVLWVNPDLPFQMEIGKPTNLSLFLTSDNETTENVTELGIEPRHKRSVLLGRVVFGEKKNEVGEQQLYRDIDIKGGGYVFHRMVEQVRKKGTQGESWGILNFKDANHDMGISETLHGLGIRTHRVIAIAELEEIIYLGKKISIAEAKKKKLISEQSRPVLEIRAFGTRARLVDVINRNTPRTKKDLLLEDARLLVADGLGRDAKEFTLLEYAKWLAQITGKNVGLMHKNGFIHKYFPQGHNITLDGCLVDFDSVELADKSSKDDFLKDYNDASLALSQFFSDGMGLSVSQERVIYDEYARSYDENIK